MDPLPATPAEPSATRTDDRDPHRVLAFGAVTLAFLAVTVAESILAPLYPSLSATMGLDLSTAGAAFGLLTGSIAVGNFAGGFLLARYGPRVGVILSLVLAGAGCASAASASGRAVLLLAQVLIGLGAGVFFAPGINAAGRLAPTHRRGLAMGAFGLAFSIGLALAAGLAAIGSGESWRLAFWVAAGGCGLAAVTARTVTLPPHVLEMPGRERRRLRDALGPAVVVGSVGAVSQYGTVSFLPVFAVVAWGASPVQAAVLLALARVLSAPGKLAVGWSADRWGAAVTVRGIASLLAATGLTWTLGPRGVVVSGAAVVFAAAVSTLFPVANLLAIEGFGDRGPLLGTFRSTQIAVGAAGAATLGWAANVVGLRAVLAVAALAPATLLATGLRTHFAARQAVVRGDGPTASSG